MTTWSVQRPPLAPRASPPSPRKWRGPDGGGPGAGAAQEAELRRAQRVYVNVSVLHSSIVCRCRRCCRRCRRRRRRRRKRRSLQPRASSLPPRTGRRHSGGQGEPGALQEPRRGPAAGPGARGGSMWLPGGSRRRGARSHPPSPRAWPAPSWSPRLPLERPGAAGRRPPRGATGGRTWSRAWRRQLRPGRPAPGCARGAQGAGGPRRWFCWAGRALPAACHLLVASVGAVGEHRPRSPRGARGGCLGAVSTRTDSWFMRQPRGGAGRASWRCWSSQSLCNSVLEIYGIREGRVERVEMKLVLLSIYSLRLAS